MSNTANSQPARVLFNPRSAVLPVFGIILAVTMIAFPVTAPADTYTVAEGETATVTASIGLAPYNGQRIEYDYATSGGTALNGTDFDSVSGTLTYSPTETSKTIDIETYTDDCDESDEDFTIKFTNRTCTSTDYLGNMCDYISDLHKVTSASHTIVIQNVEGSGASGYTTEKYGCGPSTTTTFGE